MEPLPLVICLMGPTSSGKTALAVEIVQHFPCEIISVDSAMVYRGMDIGTAKPGNEILDIAPHRLIDVCDPSEAYSAGRFRDDALREINDIIAQNKTPLLTGGTMMYFRALQQGLAAMPKADPVLRSQLDARIATEGLAALHTYLASVDPQAAARINVNDSQRIQRALEVYLTTRKTITAWQQEKTNPFADYRVVNIALIPDDRALLHERIAIRFELMLQMGLIEEVKRLYERGDLSPLLPSIRSVGYRQVWEFLDGDVSYDTMREKAIAATRQLAKRQLTWLRSWPDLIAVKAESKDVFGEVRRVLLSSFATK